MAKSVLDSVDRTGTYENGETFVQWANTVNAKILTFASAWNFTPSMDEWDVDRIDTAKPIFTKISDVLGTFSFAIKNLVSLYDISKPPTDDLLLSKWITDIAVGQPPEIIFAPVMRAVETDGNLPTNPFVNLIFTGRVMSVPIDQVLDQGVQDVVISGEIINIDQIRREAAANEEG